MKITVSALLITLGIVVLAYSGLSFTTPGKPIELPQTIANLTQLRQQRMVLNELEVERLDWIRHPEKYRGK